MFYFIQLFLGGGLSGRNLVIVIIISDLIRRLNKLAIANICSGVSVCSVLGEKVGEGELEPSRPL